MGLLGKRKEKFKKTNISEGDIEDEEEDIEDELPSELKEFERQQLARESKPMTMKQIDKEENRIQQVLDMVTNLQNQLNEVKKQESQPIETKPVDERVRVVREYLIHPYSGEVIKEYYDKKTGINWKFITDLEFLSQIANSK